MDIDSGWSTGYNNFVFDTQKYPNASQMVRPVDLIVYVPLSDYPNFGSGIGGYRNGSGHLGRTKELLIRWAQ